MEIVNLRPTNLEEFKGKQQIKENLRVFINSSKNNHHPLDHVLLYGMPGTGKTTIANIIANEYNRKIKVIQGTQLKKVSDLINCVSLITEGDFLFIDEIHAVSIECLETLYSILEDYCIDIRIGPENNQKVTRVSLPHFTLIAATTNINKLPKPLEERFPIFFFFDLYNEEEIFDIVDRSANILKIDLSNEEKEIITKNCKGVPRIANNLLKRIIDFKFDNKEMKIKDILEKLGIYINGLQEIDIKYLLILNNNEDAMGLKTLSSILEVDQQTLENKVEPFLLKSNLIKKSCRGRIITKNGINLIKSINYEYHQSN